MKGFIQRIIDGLSHVSNSLSNIFSPIGEGAEMIMKSIDERIIKIEKRILRKMSILLIIWFGAIFLVFALFFALKEYLGWSNTFAFLSIGIVIFVIGLLLKIKELER